MLNTARLSANMLALGYSIFISLGVRQLLLSASWYHDFKACSLSACRSQKSLSVLLEKTLMRYKDNTLFPYWEISFSVRSLSNSDISEVRFQAPKTDIRLKSSTKRFENNPALGTTKSCIKKLTYLKECVSFFSLIAELFYYQPGLFGSKAGFSCISYAGIGHR